MDLEGIEYFNLEDAQWLLQNLGGENATPIPSIIEKVEMPIVSLEELDLDALAGALHGITDPIGQLKDWLYERLKELASWFADTVKGTVEWLWNSFISPALNELLNVVDSIWSFLQEVPGSVSNLINWIGEQLKGIWNWIQDYLISPLANAFESFISTITQALENVISSISEIPETLQDSLKNLWDWIQSNIVAPLAKGISSLIDAVSQGLQTVASFFTKTLPEYISEIPKMMESALAGVWDWIQKNVLEPLSNALQTLTKWIESGVKTLTDFFTKTLPEYLGKIGKTIEEALNGAWAWIQKNIISPLARALENLGKIVEGSISALVDFFTKKLPEYVSEAGKAIYNTLSGAWEWIQKNIIDPLSKAFGDFVEMVRKGLGYVYDFFTKTLPGWIEDVAKKIVSLPELLWEKLTLTGKTIWEYITGLAKEVEEGFSKVTQALEQTGKYLYLVGSYLTGFINSIANLPQWLYEKFSGIFDAIAEGVEKVGEGVAQLSESVGELFTDFGGFLEEKLVPALWDVLKWIGEKMWEGLQWLGEALWKGLKDLWTWLGDALRTAGAWLWKTLVDIGKAVKAGLEEIFNALVVTPLKGLVGAVDEIWFGAWGDEIKGGIGLMLDVAWRFLWEYWKSTILIYLVSKLPEAFGDFEIKIEPEGFGTKAGGISYKIKLGELAEALVEGIKDFYPSFLTGTFVGIGTTLMRPVEYAWRAKFVTDYNDVLPKIYKDILKKEVDKGAIINAFVESPTLNEILEWVRRQLVLTDGMKDKKKLDSIIATMRAHLILYGMPQWFIDYLSDTGEKLVITFKDRFGQERKMLLSTLFEIPTHSEMARMTQRDVFPGVNVMKKLGWIRGWNEDLTTLMYLMTFKYPSFEKLWEFYMRATAGLLWFSPPDTIRTIFASEAEQIGAGAPLAPLDIQRNIRTPDALRGFELALNTYFKWLEYSNFSWFTPSTEMYGIKLGAEIYSKIGGWTADSWIMADVAADIPGKIDLRWMSRFGIFMWMSEAFKKLGVKFESYQPLVEVVPKLLSAKPESPISVSLEWMSKLLQGTGLHPAWVPITTVAENIMVISDEMTLLRTGWLNLFKEGMLTVEDVEKALAGIIRISYRVGYWDPDSKTWTTGYITLPVRWLPHERRLLELRMAMDRIMDLYREIEKYVSSGVRTLAITASEGMEILKKSVDMLNTHYSALASEITGQNLSLVFDEDYIRLRLDLLKIAQQIEVRERLRYWWFRVSGWLLYRIASGYVTKEDIEKIFKVVGEVIPLFKQEIEGYQKISEAVLGIVKKENIPTPTQLATFAEIEPVPDELIKEVFEMRSIPKDFQALWVGYIKKKPLKDDFKRLLNAYYKAKRYGIKIPQAVEKAVEKWFDFFHLTDEEKSLLDLATFLEILVSESKEYIPTPSQLATINEYVPVPPNLIKEVFERRHIPKEWRDLWAKYIEVKPLANDVNYLLTRYLTVKKYGVELPPELERKIKDLFHLVGITDRELKIRELAVALEMMKETIPTLGELASMAEYIDVPLDYIKKVLEERKVGKIFADLWIRYIYARTISREVNEVVSDYRRIYEYFYVTDELTKKVISLMEEGGWTKRELEIFSFDLEIRKAYRIMEYFIPTIREFVYDALYLSEWEKLFADLLQARGVDVAKYQKQIDYYKKLIRNKRIERWRTWYVDRLMNAYAHGAITKEEALKKLQKLKDYGLSDEEINLIMDGLELQRLYILSRRGGD